MTLEYLREVIFLFFEDTLFFETARGRHLLLFVEISSYLGTLNIFINIA